jgi:hypothetical protein
MSDPIKITLTDDLKEKIKTWCKENPYTVYAHYNDEMPKEWVAKLVEATTVQELQDAKYFIEEQLCENLSDHQHNTNDYEFDRFLLEHKLDEPKIEFASDAEYDKAMDFFRDYWEYNTDDDYLKTLLRRAEKNTDIVAVPLNRKGEGFELPSDDYWGSEVKDNPKRRDSLIRNFGFSKDDIKEMMGDATYAYSILKVCGRIDLEALWNSDYPLSHIVISERDSLIIHNHNNGSGGGCAVVPQGYSKTFPALFRVDDYHYAYGVQRVFGFVSQFWSGQLEVQMRKQKKPVKK